MKNNIAFYTGCLMWAYYIKLSNKDNPKEIEGNYLLNLTPEQIEEYEYSVQVNFMDNYIDSFERDSAYYGGKKILIPENWKKILSAYSEFLTLNNGFIKTKTTEDIKLPDSFKISDADLPEVEKLIYTAIEKSDLNILLDSDKFRI